MSAQWPSRLGLAGGIDKDGTRAAALLAAGFDSIEFGTVTPGPESAVAALASRLAALAPQRRGAVRIGIGIGMGGSASPAALPGEWLAGYRDAVNVADYASFNLSARAYRPLLTAEHLPLLLRAFDTVVAEHRRSINDRRCAALTVKLPLGREGDFALQLAEAAADIGFDAVTAVLPDCAVRLDRLHELASRLHGKAAVIAVGGIRCSADVRAALAAGADGVQVHTIFAQLGAACVPLLRDA